MAYIKQKCDFCNKDAVYDTKTILGPWAYTCEHHFEAYSTKVAGQYSKLQSLEEPTLVCSICGEKKPPTEFYKYTTKGVERYRKACKTCLLAERKRSAFIKYKRELSARNKEEE